MTKSHSKPSRGGPRSAGGAGGGRGGARGRGRFGPRRRVCRVCENNHVLDYKRYQDLRPFINRLGKVLPRRATRLCAKHQRSMALQVRRARYMGLLAFSAEPEGMNQQRRGGRGGGRGRR